MTPLPDPASAQRRIIHVDMDAFYASVEQRDDPALRSVPLAVGGSRERGVVAAASYEARRFGVHSAMPAVTARRRCPGLVFVRPRFDVYKAVSQQVHAIFARYTPLIQPLSLDEAYLDVTAPLLDRGSATAIAAEIRAAIRDETGLTASAGVAYNKFLAKLASDHRKPDGLFVITPRMEPGFVEGLPVGKFHGIGPRTAARMNAAVLRHSVTLPSESRTAMAHIRTRAVHAGQAPDPSTGAIATGIAQTTAFAYGTLERGAALFTGEAQGWRYSRFANPTTAALEAKLADLEGGEAAVAFGSGMAAVSALVLGLLQPGDGIVFLGPLYGGTESHFRGLAERFGIRVTPVPDAGGLDAAIADDTRLVWVETPTNPTLRLHDLAAMAATARTRGVLTVADNTFCTPCLTRPIEHGIDLVLHSLTKYLGGHGDATGSVVVGSARLVAPVRKTGLNHLGGSLSPQEAFLFLRGLKTLPLRMAAHCEGAARVAAFLDGHHAVRQVFYPGLPGHPDHGLAQCQMEGGFGGIVAFELAWQGRAAAAALLDGLVLFTQAVSLGDVDSLACHPASTTHSFISAEARAEQGIGEGLIRLSVGIEHPDDLIDDLEQALGDIQVSGILKERR